MFALDARLEADTLHVMDLTLCRLRLMNDAALPWLVLVPRCAGITEIHALDRAKRHTLCDEMALVAEMVSALWAPDKINIGALGNMVPQLHVHVIGRYRSDRAWPGPWWGSGPATPYQTDAARAAIDRIKAYMEGHAQG